MIVDPWTALAFFLVMLFSNSAIVVGDNNHVIIHADAELENEIYTDP